jgi:hypothetical protein
MTPQNLKGCLAIRLHRAGLIGDLVQTFDDLDWCRQIRNQYAHCQWYWTQQDGLCFVNLEELAQQPTTILNDLTAGRHSIDLALLNAQEAFFWYVKECLMHLGDTYRDWDRQQGSVAGPVIYVHPKPQVVARPPSAQLSGGRKIDDPVQRSAGDRLTAAVSARRTTAV